MNGKNPIWESVKDTFRSHSRSASLVLLLVVLSVTTSLLPPLVLERAVNSLTEGGGSPGSWHCCTSGSSPFPDFFETAQNGAITIFGQKVTHGLRSTLCAKLDRL